MEGSTTPHRPNRPRRWVRAGASVAALLAALLPLAAAHPSAVQPRLRLARDNWGTPMPPVEAAGGCVMASTPVGPTYGGAAPSIDGEEYLGTGSNCISPLSGAPYAWYTSGPVPNETPVFWPQDLPQDPTAPLPYTSYSTSTPLFWGGWDRGTGAPMPFFGVQGGDTTPGEQQDPTSIGGTGACSSFVNSAGNGYPTTSASTGGMRATSGAGISGICFEGSPPRAAGVWDMATSFNTDQFDWPWNTNFTGTGCSDQQVCLQDLENDMSWAMRSFGSGATPGTEVDGLPVLQPLPYQLPSNFLQLPYNEQMFVAIDTWLLDYGQYPFVAMSATLNQAAQQSADAASDPEPVPWPGNGTEQATGFDPQTGLPVNDPNSVWQQPNMGSYDAWGGVWIGSDTNPVDAMLEFLYEDGWDPSTDSSPNIACFAQYPQPSLGGCWGHLLQLSRLTLPQSESLTDPSTMESWLSGPTGTLLVPETCADEYCVMGVGSTSSASGSLENGETWNGPSTSVLMEAFPAQPYPSDITFSLAQELPYMPADEQAVVQHLLWWTSPSLSVEGQPTPAASSTGTGSGGTGTSSSGTGSSTTPSTGGGSSGTGSGGSSGTSSTGTGSGGTGTSSGTSSGSSSGSGSSTTLPGLSGSGGSSGTSSTGTGSGTGTSSGTGSGSSGGSGGSPAPTPAPRPPQESANPNAPIQGQISGAVRTIVANPAGPGYWLVGSNGSVAAAGGAPNEGSLSAMGVSPAAPIVGIAPTASGQGYWMVGADGGVFAFGNAPYLGSVPGVLGPNRHLAAPIVGMVAAPGGDGYWMV
ncbi:hypothetical protein Acit_11350, partial [Aciditerrimonas ferrireducens]